MNNFVLLTPSGCTDIGAKINQLCIPVRESCLNNPSNGLLVACGDTWNCNYCQADSKYYIPYKENDKIQIQTLFYDAYNSDRTNPSSGWGSFMTAELNTPTGGSLVLGEFASRSMVAYSGGRSYQILEIDTSLFEDDCFSITINSHNPGDAIRETLCTQEYRKNPYCDDILTVKGIREEGSDCFGYRYGIPDAYAGDLIEYDNSISFYAYLKETGSTISLQKTGSKTTKETVTDIYTFQLTQKVPPFVKTILARQLLSAGFVEIEGVTYELDEATITNESNSGRMFLFSVDLFVNCETQSGCNI